MAKVECLVPRIRAKPVSTLQQTYETQVYDLPVKIYTEIFDDAGELIFHGRSTNTIPMLRAFIDETCAGRMSISYHGEPTMKFVTRDGAVLITATRPIIRALYGAGRMM